MFGFIKPYTPELKVKENELYGAVYCGLCRCMGKSTSRLSRLALSYDSVFLALLRISLFEEKLDVEKKRCPVCFFKKRPSVMPTEQLEYTAAVSSYLIYYNVLDDIKDSKGFKKITSYLIYPFAKRIKKKAKPLPEIEKEISEHLSQIERLEKENTPSVDKVADVFGRLMGKITAYGIDDEQKRLTAYEAGYHTGRFIYIADAVDDYEKDKKSKEYNPFIVSNTDMSKASERLYRALCTESSHVYGACALLTHGMCGAICENIAQLGLVHTAKTITEKQAHPRKEI